MSPTRPPVRTPSRTSSRLAWAWSIPSSAARGPTISMKPPDTTASVKPSRFIVRTRVRADIRLTAGARPLVRTMKRLGFTLAVVSGGFIEIVGPLAAELGIDHAHANRLDVRDGVLTGGLVGDIVDRQGKATALRRFATEEGLPLSR